MRETNRQMNNREMFNEAVYKALADGVSKLIRQGTAITVLLGCVTGLAWGIFYLHGIHMDEVRELRAEMAGLRMEHSEQLNALRRTEVELRQELAICNEARRQDSARIARLEGLMQRRNR